jgi:peptide/nickel transport system ATP-binding protein
MSEQNMLSIEGLTRVFDVSKPFLNRLLEREPKQFLTAVNQVSFELEKGKTFALVGESGSGKSTIAKMVVNLLSPSDGSVKFHGETLNSLSGEEYRTLRRKVQMIFQDPFASLNPRWRVGDIIAEPIYAFGLSNSKEETSKKVEELLETVGLGASDRFKFPHEFSGGQRQRIAIARALSANPEFLVCDEPTSALDVSVQAQILNLMKDLQTEFNLTYLFISHDLSVVKHMADKIGVLYLGSLVEVGESESLFQNPRHPYTKMLLDSIPDHEMSGRARTPVTGEIPNPIDPPSGCPFHPRCPKATDQCKAEKPAVRDVAGSDVACFNPD